MIPTINSYNIQQKLSRGLLMIYPDSGHGFLYEFASTWAKHVQIFLDEEDF